MRRTTWVVATLTAGALLLAGCGSGGSSSAGTGSPAAGAGSSAPAPAPAPAVLTTWTSPLGPIVVLPGGSPVYVFDRDTADPETSSCTGTCARTWPPVTAPASPPQVSGVTGTVGALSRPDGTRQLTLDGRPLYTCAGDTPGQVTGQGVQGVWWVVDPAGHAVDRPVAPSSMPSSPGSGASGY